MSPSRAGAWRAWIVRLSFLATAVVALVLERLQAISRAPPTDFDDAYMVLRYAHNALSGRWMVWNPGDPPVFGVSSLLHLGLITLLGATFPGLGDATLLRVASAMPAFALVGVLAALGARFGRTERSRTPSGDTLAWAALLLILLFHRDAFVFHALTGMDTMLGALGSAGVVFASLWLAERPSPTRAVIAAAVGLIAIEARPENVPIAVLCPLLALWLLAPTPRRCAFGTWAGVLAGLFLLDLTAKWRLLGTPVPLAFYVKRPGYYRAFAGEYTWNPFLFLEVALSTVSPFLVAVILFARRTSVRLLLVLLVPAAVTISVLFYFNQIMGHLGRFYFPSLPLLIAAGLLVTGRRVGHQADPLSWGDLGPQNSARAVVLRLVAAALGLVFGARALEFAGRAYEARGATQPLASPVDYRVRAETPLPERDSWRSSEDIAQLAKEAPAGATFAMSEHGLVAARAPRAVIIDLIGLHDPIFARRGFSAAELWRRAPDVIWMPHPDYTQMLRDILESDELWRHYSFYPDAFTYGLALRRDGPRAAVLEPLLSKLWQAAYPGLKPSDYAAERAF